MSDIDFEKPLTRIDVLKAVEEAHPDTEVVLVSASETSTPPSRLYGSGPTTS